MKNLTGDCFSLKVTCAVYQLVMRILVQIWAFYNDAF